MIFYMSYKERTNKKALMMKERRGNEFVFDDETRKKVFANFKNVWNEKLRKRKDTETKQNLLKK